jgi:hypothetical protein
VDGRWKSDIVKFCFDKGIGPFKIRNKGTKHFVIQVVCYNWRILTNKEIYAILKKPTTTETITVHRLRWFGHVQRIEENRISKTVLYMNLETTRPRGRPRNR